MRGVLRFVLPLALVALLALGLSACGGGDSEDSTSSSPAGTTQESTAPTPAEDQGPGQGEEGAGDDKGSSSNSSDDAAADDSASAEEGSASFRVKGGDNSIQNYGEEADSAEVDAASSALAGYLRARATGDWAKQCVLLAKAAVTPLEQLASSAPQFKGKGCAAILEGLVGQAPASSRANPMTTGVASLRFEGDRGFALFHGTGGTDYFMPMVKEGDEWKLGAIAPSEFP